MGFFRHVSGRVVPGQRVLGHHETDENDPDRVATEAPTETVVVLGEDARYGLVLVRVRQDEQRAHDHDDAGEVPPHADVVQLGDDIDAHGVQDSVRDENQRVDPKEALCGPLESGRQVQEESGERRHGEVDGCRDRDLAEQVEPTGEPTPHRSPALRRELRCPVIKAARGREA